MKSVQHSKSFVLNRPADELFPLFSPEGETHWVPGWTYETPMVAAPLAEDYVFLTKAHDHAASNAIWLVKRYDRAARMVEFYKVEPNDKVGTVKVRCMVQDANSTQVEVSYKYQALSSAGEAFVADFTAAAYDAFIGQWQVLLEQYLAQGSIANR